MQYTVYYWKDPNIISQIFLDGKKPTPETLLNTHIELGLFEAPNREDLLKNMQSETMPSKILNTIQAKQPSHTSMLEGDVVRDGKAYFIHDRLGFTRIF